MRNVGERLDGGRYTILAALGKGGAGSVYRVQDNRAVPGFSTEYALKEFSVGELRADERSEAAEGFRSEVRLLMSLNHPYITQVVNFFAEGESYFIVMDLVDGTNLGKAQAAANNHLPLATVLDWFWQTCDVLVYLHRHDPPIIFRDLKPGNIMVTRTGNTIKLIDFGIARFFKRDSVGDTRALGTPGYAPPEQYGRSQTDERSDIYALGVTFWQLLTGADATEHIFNLPPARSLNPAVPPALEQLLTRMTQMEPADRPPSMVAVRQALAAIYPQPAHSTPPQTLYALQGTTPLPDIFAANLPGQPALAPSTPPKANPGGRQGGTPATSSSTVQANPMATATRPPVATQSLSTRRPSEQAVQPVKPVTSPAKPTPAAKPRRSPLVPTFVLALLLVAGVVGASYFNLLPFTLPFIGSSQSGGTPLPANVQQPATSYPVPVAPLPGVTEASYNSRSVAGEWWQAGYDWGRTNASQEVNSLPTGTVSWTYPIALTATATLPLLAGDALFLVGPDATTGVTSVLALKTVSGEPLWSFASKPDSSNPAPLAYAEGDKGTPLLFYVGDDRLAALDPLNSGRAVWKKETIADGVTINNLAQPVVINGAVYLPFEASIALFDAASGQPITGSNTVRGEPTSLVAASPNAATSYTVSCDVADKQNTCQLTANQVSKPPLWQQQVAKQGQLLATGDTVYLATDGNLQAYNAADGAPLWGTNLGGTIQLAAKANTLLAASGPNLHALDVNDGHERWSYQFPDNGQAVGAPIIVGEVAYQAAGNGNAGTIYALDLRRGGLLKSYSTKGQPRSGVVYASGVLYYIDSEGLHALR